MLSNLYDLRLQTRRLLGDLQPTNYYWDDSEIDDGLNEGAAMMCLNVQPFHSYHQFTTTIGQQEYPMPDDFDEVFMVNYPIGSVQNELEPCDGRNANTGTRVTGIPTHYYVKKDAMRAINLQTSGSLLVTPNNSNDPQRAIVMMGLLPRPNAANQCTVSYWSKHYTMSDNLDTTPIPFEYRRYLCQYAAAMCHQRDDNFGKSTLLLASYNNGRIEFANKYKRKGIAAFPKAKLPDGSGNQLTRRRKDTPIIMMSGP